MATINVTRHSTNTVRQLIITEDLGDALVDAILAIFDRLDVRYTSTVQTLPETPTQPPPVKKRKSTRQ